MTEQNLAPPMLSEADWIAGFEAMGRDPDTDVEFAVYAAYEVIFSEAALPEPRQAAAEADTPRSGC